MKPGPFPPLPLIRALTLAVVLALGGAEGCSFLKPQPIAELKMPSTLSEAGKQAQNLINEANVAITAAYNVVAANLENGTMSAVDGAKYIAALDDYAKKVDAAQSALNLGQVADAKTQAEALNKLIVALHKAAMAGSK